MSKFDFSMKSVKFNSPKAPVFMLIILVAAIFMFYRGMEVGQWLFQWFN